MSKYDEKIKILMLKGEKGDEYDDTELRTEIDTKLANTPYVKYSEDDDYELPIHSINDNETSNVKTWSSEKISEEIGSIIDDSQTAEDSENTTISAHKIFNHLSDINRNVDTIYNDVTSLKGKAWKYVGTLNTTDTRSLRIDFTDSKTSTVIILTVNNTNADGNNVFIYRKTMLTPPITSYAWKIAGASNDEDEIKVFGDYVDGTPYIFVTNNAPQSSGIGCAVYCMYIG